MKTQNRTHLRPATDPQIRCQWAALHLLSHGGPLRRGLQCRRAATGWPSGHGGRGKQTALIILPHPVLQYDLLLLRLQQDHHQGSRRSAKYLKYLGKEIAMQAACLDGSRDVTPAAPRRRHADLPVPRRNARADGHRSASTSRWCPTASTRSRSIRARWTSTTVKLLAELGFNRMSVGVQDFAEDVQKAVNRVQSFDETKLVIDAAARNGFKSVSVDLIYGLPKQNVISFNRTLEQVLELSPDRLSIYNYAHLPSLFKPQRRINEPSCPPPTPSCRSCSWHPPPDRGRLRLHRHGPLRQARRRAHRGPAPGPAAPQLPGLFDPRRVRPDGLRRVGHRQGRPELLRRTSRRSTSTTTASTGRAAGAARHRAHRRRPAAAAIIQALMCHFELSIESIEIAHLIDFKRVLRRRAGRPARDGKGRPAEIDGSGSACSRAAACWCAASPWCSTATCAPTASAPATPR
jgi:oxygen-independent coproporphyrinogen-3 oxidase